MSNYDGSQIDALLIGYEDHENLGLRSILAYLLDHGYRARLAPFLRGHEAELLEVVRHLQPRLIGFSLIFQFTLDEFGNLMRHLRANGVTSHFTAGGHFPSLCPENTLELLPELDSVVRFEGELTLPELLDRLDEPAAWASIPGLAFWRDDKVVLTPPRPLVSDLDSLPTVYRDHMREAVPGVPMAAMLASRGCLFNCTFCSIRQFYGGAPGVLRRVRTPQAVADEMLSLFNEHGVRYFSFQDDDFAARTPQQRDWLNAYLQALDERGLSDQIRWKISCRVDDLEPPILEAMIERGLIAIYLGVESGSNTGLRTLNKHVTVEQNLRAVALLKEYDVALAMGFMIFEPSTTITTIRENLAFLRTVGEDGYFPINFCKMLPYAGTPIEASLRAAGRLAGSTTRPDYAFLDPHMDWYAFLVQRIFTRRNFTSEGAVARLQQVDFDYRLARSLGHVESRATEAELRQLVREFEPRCHRHSGKTAGGCSFE